MYLYKGSSVKARDSLFVLVFVIGALAALANSGAARGFAGEEVPTDVQNVAAGSVQVVNAAPEDNSTEQTARDKTSDEKALTVQGRQVVDMKVVSPASVEDVSDDGRIKSMSFQKDWGVRDALQFLGASYRKNIIPSTQVEGALTITSLYNVTFDEALDAILGYGFKYEEEGNFIKVFTADEYKKIMDDEGRKIYKIFTLYYISATEAKRMLVPVLSATARIEATTAAVVDFPTGESISTVKGGGDATALNDTLIIHDFPEKIEEAVKVLRAVDVRPKQVLIEATILSVNLTEDMQFGIDWQSLTGALPAIASPALSDISSTTSDLFRFKGSSQVTKSGGLTVGFAIDDLGVFIRDLEEITDVTIMANPKILAVNKQLGQVYIGKKLGYKNQTTQTQTSTTEQVAFLDTGTKLSFRPYIGDDGYIRMDIHPKDSSGALNAQNVPDETSAELVTNIIVRDGQTVVIGGLFRDKITTKRSQIPVLGNLPLVGGAFRSTADNVERQEVVVLLTPHIIGEPNETGGQARAEDVNRKRQGATDELQFFGRAKLVEDYYAEAARYYVEGDKMMALKKLNVVLRLQPSYLDGIRLKERILEEASPAERKKFERLMMVDIERQAAPKWRSR